MTSAVLIAIAAGYATLLFALAWWAERRGEARGAIAVRWTYPLALAVYCTSWTFFGAVGSAYHEGWTFLPIYLGPILLYAFGTRWLGRLVAAAQTEGATSVSDFIGARFGRNPAVGASVTLIALLGVVPYLALQLRSIGASYQHITGSTDDPVLITAMSAGILALFALLFGTRRFDTAGRSDGLLFAVAVESLVQLVAFMVIGLFAAMLVLSAPREAQTAGLALFRQRFAPDRLGLDMPVIMLIAAAAVVCLPRQFYTGVIGASSPLDVERARTPFIAYLAITTLIVLPITLAGFVTSGGMAAGDQLVIDLPLSAGADGLALLVFLGGFSAATAMVIVETVALSTMVSNSLVAPLLLRSRAWTRVVDMGARMLMIRRLTIVALMGVAMLFATLLGPNTQLASIGLIAFAAMAQLAPAMLLGVRRDGRNPVALLAALAAGISIWFYTLLLPSIAPGFAIALRGSWADPQSLFGIGNASPIVHGVLWSLGANLIVHAVVAGRRLRPRISFSAVEGDPTVAVADRASLITLVARFVGEDRARAQLTGLSPNAPIDRATARTAERLLAGVVGTASAHTLMSSALLGARMTVGDVTRLLDDSGQSLQFSRDLLAATLENIDPGVSVIDRDLNLIAWNSRYLELFDYPPGMIYVGAPVADLIRNNAMRGECGPGEVEAHVQRRLAHMKRGLRHSFERVRPDGRVLQTVGGPMPGGGYVMCFTDVTAEAETRAALEGARAGLEQRVAQRTTELSDANRALARATQDKTRFLAAASHDLMQPLHAARLFTSALERSVQGREHEMVQRIERSIGAAEQLLRTLLDISRLDAGGIVPAPERISVRALLEDLVESFTPLAAERGLSLRLASGDAAVVSDRVLLRSIVQNFLSNAVRYTQRGGIVVGVRRRGGTAQIVVFDTGPGIASKDRARIFREFERVGTREEAGIGLGLAIVERTARLLDAHIEVDSVPGRGSRFSVSLPLAAPTEDVVPAEVPGTDTIVLPSLRVIVVDDAAEVRTATLAFLHARGHRAVAAADVEGALQLRGTWDVALLDYDLDGPTDGIMLAQKLRETRPGIRIALVTADRTPDVARRAQQAGLVLLSKPLDPQALRRWLAKGFAVAG